MSEIEDAAEYVALCRTVRGLEASKFREQVDSVLTVVRQVWAR